MASPQKPCYEKLADAELLDRYRARRDEAAFSALVRRHHDLVLGVCQRRLRSRHDAEDAFQATFLVLAQKGHTIRKKASLASWLYGVAYRTSLRLGRQRARDAVATLEVPVMVDDDPLRTLTERHEQLVADEELAALPDRLRAPLVLRYLSGKSNEEVAHELHISVVSVEGRLKRAKRRLRGTLARRGIAVTTALAAMGAVRTVQAHATAPLVAKTVAACLGSASTVATTSTGGVSGSVASHTAFHLACKEVAAMTTLKLSNAAAAVTILVCTVSLGFGIRNALSQQPAESAAGVIDLAAGDAAGTGAEVGAAASAGESGSGATFATGGGAGRTAADPIAANAAYDVLQRSKSELRIRAALQSATELDFFDVPLSEAMDFISNMHEIPIELDRSVLEDAGVDSSTPVNARYRGMSLRAALRLMLRELDLTYVIEEEYLQITTPEEAELRLDTRVYPIRPHWNAQPADLVAAITKIVSQESWDEVGGPGSIKALGENLIVSQNEQVHEEIKDLLRQLDAAARLRARQQGSYGYGAGGYGEGYGPAVGGYSDGGYGGYGGGGYGGGGYGSSSGGYGGGGHGGRGAYGSGRDAYGGGYGEGSASGGTAAEDGTADSSDRPSPSVDDAPAGGNSAGSPQN